MISAFDLRCSLKPALSNFRLVRENPVVVDTYIASEVAVGCLNESRDPSLRRNPITCSIILKLNQPGKLGRCKMRNNGITNYRINNT